MTTTPFDILCPQHLCFDNDGIITHVGPSLRSVISPAADQPLFGLLTILRPLGISDLPTLFAHTGRALSVKFRGKMICACAVWLRDMGMAAYLAYLSALRYKARLNVIA